MFRTKSISYGLQTLVIEAPSSVGEKKKSTAKIQGSFKRISTTPTPDKGNGKIRQTQKSKTPDPVRSVNNKNNPADQKDKGVRITDLKSTVKPQQEIPELTDLQKYLIDKAGEDLEKKSQLTKQKINGALNHLFKYMKLANPEACIMLTWMIINTHCKEQALLKRKISLDWDILLASASLAIKYLQDVRIWSSDFIEMFGKSFNLSLTSLNRAEREVLETIDWNFCRVIERSYDELNNIFGLKDFDDMQSRKLNSLDILEYCYVKQCMVRFYPSLPYANEMLQVLLEITSMPKDIINIAVSYIRYSTVEETQENPEALQITLKK